MKIAYFGFSSLGNSLARFFYNCTDDKVYTPTQLVKACERSLSENNNFNTFRIANDNLNNSESKILDFQFFAEAKSDFSVRFTVNENDESGYAIGKCAEYSFEWKI